MSASIDLRGIRDDVAREAKALAAREGITLTALVERALERETRGARSVPARLSEIAQEIEWYEQNKASLLDCLEGEYLAIVDQAVVDNDPDLDALAERVAERYGARSVYLPLCQDRDGWRMSVRRASFDDQPPLR